ncbi:transcriptional regulator [Gallibacterium salpingitidis]|uniref:Transcriptional regulator n=1 Tax=Gallibacterium salpingitidis TaxID=505341 RepID=A0AB36E4Z0_9PAST|nr:LysR family transcriptional regulator [Gallibacterium salpingitidis]OBX08087.1 transcriptional regulator [Gallibacterium salpingitidis]OBX11744.1 transcriptional regulator [Gallibacterium salpingitidis]
MDTLQSMKIFRQIVESGSFSKAADQLDLSVSMVSKHLSHLENYLQAKLLNRTSRKLSLTEMGEHYYQRCIAALDDLEEAKQVVSQGTIHPQGTLKITMPVWFATQKFADLLAEYCRRYPKVNLQLSLDNHHADLVGQGFDLALKVTAYLSENLIVKPITNIAFHWVASPQYLTQFAQQSEQQWDQHRGLIPTYTHLDQHFTDTIASDNTLMLYQLALAGQGVAYLPSYLCEVDIQAGKLQIIPHPANRNHTLYVAYMNRQFMSAKVRSFIDFMAENFRCKKREYPF